MLYTHTYICLHTFGVRADARRCTPARSPCSVRTRIFASRNSVRLVDGHSDSGRCVYTSIQKRGGWLVRTTILPTSMGRPLEGAGRYRVEMEMGWHPIVYTLLSTPTFPGWLRPDVHADLQWSPTRANNQRNRTKVKEDRLVTCVRDTRVANETCTLKLFEPRI